MIFVGCMNWNEMDSLAFLLTNFGVFCEIKFYFILFIYFGFVEFNVGLLETVSLRAIMCVGVRLPTSESPQIPRKRDPR